MERIDPRDRALDVLLAERLGGRTPPDLSARIFAAAARGDEAEPTLPDSVCFVHHSLEPPELTRIATRYRIRGDGEIVQEVDQRRINQPRGEAQAWAREMLRDALGLL